MLLLRIITHLVKPSISFSHYSVSITHYKAGTHEQQHLEENLIYKPAVPKFGTDRDTVQANAREVLKIGYPLGKRLSDKVQCCCQLLVAI